MTAARPAGALQRLARQSTIYAVGNVAAKASGLLIVPLYLNLLPQADYGYLGLLTAIAVVAVPLAGFGLTTGLLTFLAAPDAGPEARRALPFTTLAVSAAAALAVFGLFWALAEPVAGLVLDDRARAGLVRLTGAYVAAKVLAATPLMLIRAGERAGLYVAASVVETLLLAGGTYVSMAVYGLGLAGAVGALALSAGASAAVLTAGALARVEWVLDRRLVAKLVRFGAPLALSAVALPVVHVGDRFVLKALAGAEEVAVYDLAARLAGLLNMLVVQSFQQAFAVVGLKELREGGDFFRRTFRHYAVGAGGAVLGVSLFARDVIALVSPGAAYLRADPMVFVLSLGFLAYGLYIVFANVLYAATATRAVALALVLAVAVNMALNLLLVPALGGLGAALATLAAYAGMAAMTAFAADRRTHIAYPWSALAVCLGLVVVLWGVSLVSAGWALAPRLAFRAALVAAYLPLVLAAGVYGRAEVRALLRDAGRRLGLGRPPVGGR